MKIKNIISIFTFLMVMGCGSNDDGVDNEPDPNQLADGEMQIVFSGRSGPIILKANSGTISSDYSTANMIDAAFTAINEKEDVQLSITLSDRKEDRDLLVPGVFFPLASSSTADIEATLTYTDKGESYTFKSGYVLVNNLVWETTESGVFAVLTCAITATKGSVTVDGGGQKLMLKCTNCKKD